MFKIISVIADGEVQAHVLQSKKVPDIFIYAHDSVMEGFSIVSADKNANCKPVPTGDYHALAIKSIHKLTIKLKCGASVDVSDTGYRGLDGFRELRVNPSNSTGKTATSNHVNFTPNGELILSKLDSIRDQVFKAHHVQLPETEESLESGFSSHKDYIVELLKKHGLTPTGDVTFQTIDALLYEFIDVTKETYARCGADVNVDRYDSEGNII